MRNSKGRFLFSIIVLLGLNAVALYSSKPADKTSLKKGLNRDAVSKAQTAATSKDRAAFPAMLHLGKPLSPLESITLNDFKVASYTHGRETHVLLTDAHDTTKPSFLIINAINGNGSLITQAFPVIKHLVKTPVEGDPGAGLIIKEPQFSPNGRYILFKYGQVASPGIYQLYIFDAQTYRLQPISKFELQYYAVSWSPDGEYVAFAKGVEDPTFYDNGRTYRGKLKLYICQWRFNKMRLVVESATLRGPWTWKAPHTLLYSALSPKDDELFLKSLHAADSGDSAEETIKSQSLPPNTYEYLPETGKSQLILRDAYMPVWDAENKYLAFIGSPASHRPIGLNRDFQTVANRQFVLVVEPTAKSNQTRPGKRIALTQVNEFYPHLIWHSQRQRLLILQQTSPAPISALEVKEWDIDKKVFHLIATIKARDSESGRPEGEPTFTVLGLSQDKKKLFIIVSEFYSVGQNQGVLNRDTLQYIDLAQATLTTIGSVNTSTGLGWSDFALAEND